MSKRKHQEKMSIGHIYIEEDGWVWVETRDGKHELGLGDIDVDVFIHDKRKQESKNNK